MEKTAPGSLLTEGEVLVLGEERAEWALRTAGAEEWRVVAAFGPGGLAGRTCRHPLAGLGFGPEVPVFSGSFVAAGEGTGFVHAAPALGPEDHAFGLEHGLDAREVLRADGTLAEDLPAFGGLAVLGADGRKGPAEGAVLAAARGLGAAAWVGAGLHREARSWRSKAPLLWRCSPQWFLDVSAAGPTLRGRVEKLSFVPEAGRRRLAAVVAGRPDWCLSRQRLWGVPLGLFVDAGGEVLVDAEVSSRVVEAFEEEGGGAWWSWPKERFLAGRTDAWRWEKCMDVLDVWFEAGCSPSWAGARPGRTADLVLEGSDQHRGWFQACLSAGALEPEPPFAQVATHGFVEDALGRKMSKSKGNGADPEALAKEWGADALRVWAAESDWRGDPRLSDGALRAAAGFVADARNSLRFLLGCLEAAWPAEEDLPAGSSPPRGAGGHERRLLSALAGLEDDLRRRSDALDTVGCVRALRTFLAKDLSAGWVEARKDALYCDDPKSPRAKAARGTCLAALLRLCALLSPFAPFAAAEAEAFLRAAWREGGARLPEGPVETWRWAEEEPKAATAADAALEELRRLAGGALEAARAEKRVGSSGAVRLDAKLPPDLAAALDPNEAAEACGCALVLVSASPTGAGAECRAGPAEGTACPRCRKVRMTARPSFGASDSHGTFDPSVTSDPSGDSRTVGLCRRCAEAEDAATATTAATPCHLFGEDLEDADEYRKEEEENTAKKSLGDRAED